MTADNTIGNGQGDLVTRAETKLTLPHTTEVKPPPRATGVVIIGGGTPGKNYMSETEKLAAQNDARRAIFRS